MGHQHRGGGHYVSPDGSVNWFVEPLAVDSSGAPTGGGSNAMSWYVVGQRGTMINMGLPPLTWGVFERY